MPVAVLNRYVLVVEDDAALRELYRSALRAAGYAVVAVEDGLDALRRVEDKRPDAVVLDLGLPRLGGRDVHRELQASPDTRHIPVVVVSADDTSDLNPRDFACILAKPTGVEALITAVRNCMRRARSTNESLTPSASSRRVPVANSSVANGSGSRPRRPLLPANLRKSPSVRLN